MCQKPVDGAAGFDHDGSPPDRSHALGPAPLAVAPVVSPGSGFGFAPVHAQAHAHAEMATDGSGAVDVLEPVHSHAAALHADYSGLDHAHSHSHSLGDSADEHSDQHQQGLARGHAQEHEHEHEPAAHGVYLAPSPSLQSNGQLSHEPLEYARDSHDHGLHTDHAASSAASALGPPALSAPALGTASTHTHARLERSEAAWRAQAEHGARLAQEAQEARRENGQLREQLAKLRVSVRDLLCCRSVLVVIRPSIPGCLFFVRFSQADSVARERDLAAQLQQVPIAFSVSVVWLPSAYGRVLSSTYRLCLSVVKRRSGRPRSITSWPRRKRCSRASPSPFPLHGVVAFHDLTLAFAFTAG